MRLARSPVPICRPPLTHSDTARRGICPPLTHSGTARRGFVRLSRTAALLAPELGSEGLRSGDVEFHVGGVVRSMIFVGESETRVRGGDYWEAKLEDEGCMRDLVRFLCFVKNLGRLRRDCGLVIRSRGVESKIEFVIDRVLKGLRRFERNDGPELELELNEADALGDPHMTRSTTCLGILDLATRALNMACEILQLELGNMNLRLFGSPESFMDKRRRMWSFMKGKSEKNLPAKRKHANSSKIEEGHVLYVAGGLIIEHEC
ncbi:hypothetical protein Syun_018198 [Stephania yunnanensis]|uniref:Uncharacterized protein n=1 Tax=Stephania yunnanensis TaxID=152371 RepID=A0AAP0NY52_9MAGN